MPWWRKKPKRSHLPDRIQIPQIEYAYGLHPDNPILCGCSVEGQIDYLQRLRCPAGMPVFFKRQQSVERTGIDYLNGPGVELAVSRGTRRRMGEDFDAHKYPLDAYLFVCECEKHEGQLFLDMYFHGPELPIGIDGWTLVPGQSLFDKMNQKADCPHCGKELRTAAAKQCRFCKMDWHDPDNVFQRT